MASATRRRPLPDTAAVIDDGAGLNTGWIASLALLLAPGPAGAAWLALCDAETPLPDTHVLGVYPDPQGHSRRLVISEHAPEGCDALSVDVTAEDIRWAGLINSDDAVSMETGVSLLGNETQGEIRISEIIPDRPQPAPIRRAPPVPMGKDILQILDSRPFGVEGRASIKRRDGEIDLVCAAGDAPAGLLLRAGGYHMVRDGRLRVQLESAGSGRFALAFSDAQRLQRESPLVLGDFAASARPSEQGFTLPRGMAPGDHAFSLLCPAGHARLRLTGLELRPAPGLTPPARAAWVWQPEAWMETTEALLGELERTGARTVFITVPLEGEPLAVANPGWLARFIDAARRSQVSVWVVEGDPGAVLPEGQAHMVMRASALARFNASQQPGLRLAGVQYDIEPYLLAGFALDTRRWLTHYLDTIRVLRQTAGMPLEVAVPFWWSGLAAGDGPFLEQLAAVVDGVSVMNYRTDPAQIRDGARPFLAWGAEHQRFVRIALEAGPIPDQTRWQYRPFERGRLWQLEIGQTRALVLLRRPRANPAGPSFALAYAVPVSGDRTTFRGNTDALDRLLPELETDWAAWPSFAGIALHEYLRIPVAGQAADAGP